VNLDTIAQVFALDGALARTNPQFRPREAQRQMAVAVAQAIRDHRTLVVEAGTGTGKTYAYLVPTLLCGGRVIISTGTKTLQDQLFERDLPAVRAALPVPVEVALLKGRANYVCKHHLERTQIEGRLQSRDDVKALAKIVTFASRSKTGDKAECTDVPDDSAVWPRVTSTRDNCLGSECKHYGECFVVEARKAAMKAEIVVVNHHLFFADIALKDEGVAELLPACNAVIFDEAHKLPEAATLFFGEQLTSGQGIDLSRDVELTARAQAKDAPELTARANAVGLATRKLRLALGATPYKKPLHEIIDRDGVRDALTDLVTAIAQCEGAIEPHAQRTEDLGLLHARCGALRTLLLRWMTPSHDGLIRWCEVGPGHFVLHATPFSISEVFTKQREGHPRAWIFTSATLSAAGSFDHFTQQLGLDDAVCETWDSPFNYARQAVLYVPAAQFPLPSSSEHTDAVIDEAVAMIADNPGGTFVLFTSHRALKHAANTLPEKLRACSTTRDVLTQGDAPKNTLLTQFREAGNAVLLGSQSFWEGVDVQGDALTLVIIDKLPFAPPDDPVLAARLKQLEDSGGNPFAQWQLPNAAITLKQGAGRLIRSEADRGVLAVMDTRLVDKPYGKLLQRSLPPMAKTRNSDSVRKFLSSLHTPPAGNSAS
jgi:ATP-dependent DNA helicase DinG